MDWKRIVKMIGPAILAMNPATAPFAPIVIEGIVQAEGLFTKGSDKKAHVVALTKAAAESYNVKAKSKINVTAVTAAASSSVDAVVAVANIQSKPPKVVSASR